MRENFITAYSSSVIGPRVVYKTLKIEIITWERQCDDDGGERLEGPDGVHIIRWTR